MKKIIVFLLVILITTSCGSIKGGKFEGLWQYSKDSQHFLLIEHLSGNDYLVKEVKRVKPTRFDPLGWDGAIDEKYNFSLQGGKLVGGPLNSFSIVYVKGNLIYDGEEYVKAEKNLEVNIYVRTDVSYDSEGWPVEMGKVDLVTDFQQKKEYQLNGYDYIEKVEIVGPSDDITMQFINEKNNAILYEEKSSLLVGTRTFTTSNPKAEKDQYYQEWLNTKFEPLIIRISNKDKIIFEGKINPSKQ